LREKSEVDRKKWIVPQDLNLFPKKSKRLHGIPKRVVSARFGRFVAFPKAMIGVPGKSQWGKKQRIDARQGIDRVVRVMLSEPGKIMEDEIMPKDEPRSTRVFTHFA